jgi:1,2-diacylglycerol 3-beta-galactosyltransferase
LRRLDFIFFDAGGGHRAAATALKLVAEQQGRPWEIRLVNLQELLDPLDVFRKVTGLRLQEIYNHLLKRGWTLGMDLYARFMQAVIRVYHRDEVRVLERHWNESRPDLVVSFVPHFNRAITGSLRGVAPSVTVITDLADSPPHFWIERETPYVVCGTDRAVEQARAIGVPAGRIFRASGMIIHPRFYEEADVDRAAERRRLGLLPGRTTGLVLFGGYGAGVMSDIVERLDSSGLDLQLIVICGRNDAVRRSIERLKTRMPVFVEGFTTEVPCYMRLADFLIGKPGPGSISEALAMNLPVLVERNAWTMPQERFNADWVLEQGVGLVVRSFRREIAGAVRTLLEPARFEGYRTRAAAIHNRAVFEIPDFLEKLLIRP